MQRWYDADGQPIWKESIDGPREPEPIPIEKARRTRRPTAAAATVHPEPETPSQAVLAPPVAASLNPPNPGRLRSLARILRAALEDPDDAA